MKEYRVTVKVDNFSGIVRADSKSEAVNEVLHEYFTNSDILSLEIEEIEEEKENGE